jgi:hypothetical protein
VEFDIHTMLAPDAAQRVSRFFDTHNKGR